MIVSIVFANNIEAFCLFVCLYNYIEALTCKYELYTVFHVY
jgi:hypothetical protein